MKIVKTPNTHEDFTGLIRRLDAELTARYGDGQSEYDEHNRIDPIDTAVIGYVEGIPAACGCFKVLDPCTVEIKRMYVTRNLRRKGLSTSILKALEAWSRDLGHTRAVLETGKGQPEALGLYQKNGYRVIDNYGPYKDLENSICMEKALGRNFGSARNAG
ncbi:GNAT family N-acetyltransferase [Desulfospira joergensenii]|uniref:GNAT family N-acetyltransferase n=1 Tax=Desulfospira joergensenii TaxID=53329 RepID=UPI00040D2ADB|nr:GNAT family N-acetyltransferase [Desulfospira joergensenii]